LRNSRVKDTSIYKDESALVAALKERQTEAITYLYDNYSNALFGVIDRILQNEELSNDVLQEAFVKIWKNIDGYSSDKGSLFTWMLNICRNAAIDETRSKQYKKQLQNRNIEDSVNSVDHSEQVVLKVDHIGLKDVVAKLKPEQKILVDKIYFEGYTQDEVSKELGIPLGTVKTRIRAAIAQLRGVLVT
jgi:RNA polymerase sigma-70 factor (ECF subfamily)